MRKGDKCAAVLLAILVAAVSWFTRCNYKSIASEGLICPPSFWPSMLRQYSDL